MGTSTPLVARCILSLLLTQLPLPRSLPPKVPFSARVLRCESLQIAVVNDYQDRASFFSAQVANACPALLRTLLRIIDICKIYHEHRKYIVSKHSFFNSKCTGP